jgi:hypothetical protein
MSTSVPLAVQGWHDFYIMTGGASATLVGLLFTTMALRSDRAGEAGLAVEQDLWTAASVPLACFLDILLLSLAFLVPDQGALGLGLPVLALAATGTAQLFWVSGRSRSIPSLRLWGRLLPILVCYLGQAVVGVAALTAHSEVLWLVALVIAGLTLNSALISWQLLRDPILIRAKQPTAPQTRMSNGDSSQLPPGDVPKE